MKKKCITFYIDYALDDKLCDKIRAYEKKLRVKVHKSDIIRKLIKSFIEAIEDIDLKMSETHS